MKSIRAWIENKFSPKTTRDIPTLEIVVEMSKRVNRILIDPYMENIYLNNRKFEVSARKIYPDYYTLGIREFKGQVVQGFWSDEEYMGAELAKILIRVASGVPQILDIGKYGDLYSIVPAHKLHSRSISMGDPERHAEVALRNARDVVHIQPSTIPNDRTVYARV